MAVGTNHCSTVLQVCYKDEILAN